MPARSVVTLSVTRPRRWVGPVGSGLRASAAVVVGRRDSSRSASWLIIEITWSVTAAEAKSFSPS